MKLGMENKNKVIAAAALFVFGALLLFRGLHLPFTSEQPRKVEIAALQPAGSSLKPGRDEHRYVAFLLRPTIDPHLRIDLLAYSEGVDYQGSGRDIFAEHSDDIPAPVAPGLLTQEYLAPPPPPPPPPIKLKFWGWASQPGDPKAAFLAQGDIGFIAHEGDIVARRYKVVKIGSSAIDVEDVLSNNRQSIPVTF